MLFCNGSYDSCTHVFEKITKRLDSNEIGMIVTEVCL